MGSGDRRRSEETQENAKIRKKLTTLSYCKCHLLNFLFTFCFYFETLIFYHYIIV